MWLSASMQRRTGATIDCLQSRADRPLSHDNLFHTALGLMDVRTAARNPALDLSDGCG